MIFYERSPRIAFYERGPRIAFYERGPRIAFYERGPRIAFYGLSFVESPCSVYLCLESKNFYILYDFYLFFLLQMKCYINMEFSEDLNLFIV